MSEQIIPIVGAYYRKPAPAILQVLPLDCVLKLEKEPNNQFDSNAVKVSVETEEIPDAVYDALDEGAKQQGSSLADILELEVFHLGYVPKTHNQELLERWDKIENSTLCFTMEGKPAVKVTFRDSLHEAMKEELLGI